MTWTEKYRPKIFNEIKGQDEAIRKIKKFIEEFNTKEGSRNKKKVLILHGPPGTGKTALACATANENTSEIFELNASDLRNKEKIREILKPAIEQKSLTKKSKIILVDEVDGISVADKGGISELLELIQITEYPIIITANNIWDKKLFELRKKAELVQFKEIDYKTIKDVMINILKKENKFIHNELLTEIAIKSKGDLRAAINDLQAISKLDQEKIKELKFDERDKEIDIFNALKMIFKGKPSPDTLKVFDSVNMTTDEILLWLEENISAEYQGKELARAYDALSRADVFKGRIYKQQYWRFLVYENIFLSYGISASKEPNKVRAGFTSYKKPSRILKIWLHNQKITLKKSISEKYAHYVHIDKKRALNEFPIIKYILKNPKITKELKLSEEEIDYLKDSLEMNV